jgi:hypothetical protein
MWATQLTATLIEKRRQLLWMKSYIQIKYLYFEEEIIMENYTPMERILIEGAKIHQAMEDALKLDLMLLELEAKADMMDGYKMEEWVL